MPNGLKIIPSRLLDALVGVDRGVASRASKILAILVGNVLTFRILVTFSQAKIYYVN